MLEWRKDPVTDKQLAYISEMQEYSDFPIPAFIGTTKGEASDFINRWSKVAHEKFDYDGHADNYGDRI